MTSRHIGLYGIIVVIAVALDQWIKYLVETRLDMHVRVDVIPFWALYRTHNTGIAFSFLSDLSTVGLIVMTLAVIAFVGVVAVRSTGEQALARIGFALIIGGAIGNLIDRVWLGYVVDYALFYLPNWSFAVFNLADVFISLGAGLVILQEFINWRREKKSGAKSGT